ncbi:hypothetical protein DPMN_189115 [Dreissena polymorpha]|uniref:Uncharacterized protein n=1 Tax=Dreissena polymorpha TaxID=45954 RepID=A0A9D4DTH8_DREPO|nr:hypothetical protein DPMN_189115 [Dreissena polymorpha]
MALTHGNNEAENIMNLSTYSTATWNGTDTRKERSREHHEPVYIQHGHMEWD